MVPECECCGRYRRSCCACRSCGRQTCREDRDQWGNCLHCSTDPSFSLTYRLEPQRLVEVLAGALTVVAATVDSARGQ